ncbi:hypothetical protein D3C72_1972930 [compost metagenome]
MAQRENAAIAPDQVERQSEHGEGEIFAEERHGIVRQAERIAFGQQQIGHRHGDGDDQQDGDDPDGFLVEGAEEGLGQHEIIPPAVGSPPP